MGKTLTYKILEEHLASGKVAPGEKIKVRVDQTLTQDATGTMAFLQLEAMNVKRVATELSVSYVDHNMAQNGPNNQNDHRYLQTIAAKTGVYFSRAGNGICHQVHLERFGAPGKTLLGSDSHTPTSGGIGSLAIGAGGLDVAVAMGGGPFSLTCPRVIGVKLLGKLRPWVSPKDVIFRVLSILTTKGNVGCVLEYFGPGVVDLPVPGRGTITNMGAEVGVTTSIFPSDERTRHYMRAQEREQSWRPLAADEDAQYDRITKRLSAEKDARVLENIRRYCERPVITEPDEEGMVTAQFGPITIDLSELEPLCAAPSSPDNIRSVAEEAGTRVGQVLVGSCTNSSFHDLMVVSSVLKGRTVHPDVSMAIAPGSRQVYEMVARNTALFDYLSAGARIMESACGACIGQGQSPGSGVVSLRTFNRNFKGRSGTPNDLVYLVSPETAVASALTGVITDPRTLDIPYPEIEWPEKFLIDDSMIISPSDHPEAVEIARAETIGDPPTNNSLPETVAGPVLIKVGDKITTDHIMPAGVHLKLRSNIPAYSQVVFECFNEPDKPTFAQRAAAARDAGKHGIVVGGESYGQGSSREHAAICPMYLGIKAVIVKSIERIHAANLVNFGIVPLLFDESDDYDAIDAEEELAVENVGEQLRAGRTVTVENLTKGRTFTCHHNLDEEEIEMVLGGGRLNMLKAGAAT